MQRQGRITRWLDSANPAVLTAYAIVAAFSTYFCMYAFRKPFAAAKFQGLKFFGTNIDLKTAFVISQTIGYAISKYVGIKVCSEVTRQRRAWVLIGLVLASEAALLFFAVLPPNAKVVAIFLNGLPIGMVWGLVVQYLEGRRTSELLLAGLSCSFILASGYVRDVGDKLIKIYHVSDGWMPFETGLIFLPVFLLSVWMLNQLPAPSLIDIEQRVRRTPMNGAERRAFVRKFFWGLLFLVVTYFFLTAYRDFRDNFGVEIREQLHYEGNFAGTEFKVAIGVCIALAGLNLARENRLGLICTYAVMSGGLVLLSMATMLLDHNVIGGRTWYTLVGLGAYLAYVPVGSMLFDRLIASTRTAGTAVFAIYIADAVGYTGSVGIQLYKDLAQTHETRLVFFRSFTYFMSILGSVLLVASCIYFLLQARRGQVGGIASDSQSSNLCAAGVDGVK